MTSQLKLQPFLDEARNRGFQGNEQPVFRVINHHLILGLTFGQALCLPGCLSFHLSIMHPKCDSLDHRWVPHLFERKLGEPVHIQDVHMSWEYREGDDGNLPGIVQHSLWIVKQSTTAQFWSIPIRRR